MHASIRIALGLMLGIALASTIPLASPLAWAAASLLCLLSLRRSWWRDALIAVLIGGTALAFCDFRQSSSERHFGQQLDDRDGELLVGTVEGIPLLWPGRQQLLLRTADARIWLTIHSGLGEELSTLWPGHKIRVYARLRRPIGLRGQGTVDRRRQVMARGAELMASASNDDLTVVSHSWSLWLPPAHVHRWAVDRISDGETWPEGRAIVTALATGDRSKMSEPLNTAVRATGVAHLLAVSGMHLATVVALVFFLVLRLWTYTPWHQRLEPRAVAAALALLAAIGFTAMTGARASTCRALLVAAFVLAGMIIDRRIRLLHALAWSASVLLLWRPVLLWDPGFQLSFAATTALALAFGHRPGPLRYELASFWGQVSRAGRALVRASFWATLATAPIALYHFGEVSWLGLVSNLVAVPLTTLVVLPAALAGLALMSVWHGAGQWLLDLSVYLSHWLAQACYWFESHVPLQVRAPLNASELVCWALVVLALLSPWRWFTSRRRALVLLASTLFLLLSRYYAAPMAAAARESLRVTFVEIGQGDAAVIEVPGGEVWLVDGGGLPFVGRALGRQRQRVAETPARQALLPYLRHRRIDHIDLVVVSHAHPDHFVGLQAVARAMPISEIWSAHVQSEIPGPYETWLQSLQEAGTEVIAPRLGTARSRQGAVLEVLWPRYAPPGAARSDAPRAQPDPILGVNDNSLVVRLDFADRRFLFSGDIEREAEELLVQEHRGQLRADVVKVPHHGSPTSSTPDFVMATSAAIAIISCGRANHFGFPDSEVEARWRDQAKYLFRTDLVGSVTLRVSPDGAIQVETVAAF